MDDCSPTSDLFSMSVRKGTLIKNIKNVLNPFVHDNVRSFRFCHKML